MNVIAATTIPNLDSRRSGVGPGVGKWEAGIYLRPAAGAIAPRDRSRRVDYFLGYGDPGDPCGRPARDRRKRERSPVPRRFRTQHLTSDPSGGDERAAAIGDVGDHRGYLAFGSGRSAMRRQGHLRRDFEVARAMAPYSSSHRECGARRVFGRESEAQGIWPRRATCSRRRIAAGEYALPSSCTKARSSAVRWRFRASASSRSDLMSGCCDHADVGRCGRWTRFSWSRQARSRSEHFRLAGEVFGSSPKTTLGCLEPGDGGLDVIDYVLGGSTATGFECHVRRRDSRPTYRPAPRSPPPPAPRGDRRWPAPPPPRRCSPRPR